MNIDILQILIIQLFSLYLIFLNKGYKGDDTCILSTLTIFYYFYNKHRQYVYRYMFLKKLFTYLL